MNFYGQRAMEHWRKYRPTEYQAMSPEERETFFTSWGDWADQEIRTLADVKAGTGTADEPYLDRAARLHTAMVEAKSEVLREMLPPAEEDE